MKTYLEITNTSDGEIVIYAMDGIFSYSATLKNSGDFINYCQQRKEMWLNSNLGNFNGWTESNRAEIAYKWELAKYLPCGFYNCFFSLEDIETIFKNEVSKLANSLGIKDYVLTVH